MGKAMNFADTTVGLCGASGFVGTHLAAHLRQLGCRVDPLDRDLFAPGREARLMASVAACDVIVNVAGASIARRWTKKYKRELYESRVGVVHRLVEAMRAAERVRVFVSASAVGIYPSEGCYDESSDRTGESFLSALCRAWEKEAHGAPAHVRTLVTRFGVVLAPEGGSFEAMAAAARKGVGAVVGDRNVPFSWIDATDLCRAVSFLLASDLAGTFNLAAPVPTMRREAIRQIARHYGVRVLVPVPGVLLRLALGRAADILLEGQCARPARLLDAGFEFRSPDLEHFLESIS